MIDYTKIYLVGVDYKMLLKSKYLEFKTEVSETTGAINENCFIAEYLFCKITIKINDSDKAHITFTGSIHKLWNELNNIIAPNYNPSKPYKGYNGNDFTINNIIEVRSHLELVLGCKSNQMQFQNIEFGINTQIGFNPILFLNGLLYHRNKLFEFSHNGNNAQAVHNNFYFKIYNKSFQYAMTGNVLRVELKFKKMVEVQQLNFKTLADINENVLNNAKGLLLKKFDEVVNYDYSIRKESLSKSELKQIQNYSNPRYWIEDLKPIHRDRHRKKLLQIINEYSDNLHQQIRNQIIERCVIINRLHSNSNCVIINTSNIGLNITKSIYKNNKNILSKNGGQNNNTCKITGLDISMQKDSILLSHTGLRFYFEKDKKTFEQIKKRYLPKLWNNSDFEIQIKELAHNIRTVRYNQNTKQVRIYPSCQNNFLSQFEFLNII